MSKRWIAEPLEGRRYLTTMDFDVEQPAAGPLEAPGDVALYAPNTPKIDLLPGPVGGRLRVLMLPAILALDAPTAFPLNAEYQS